MCSENFKAILSLDVCTMNFGIVAFNEAEKYNLLFILVKEKSQLARITYKTHQSSMKPDLSGKGF